MSAQWQMLAGSLRLGLVAAALGVLASSWVSLRSVTSPPPVAIAPASSAASPAFETSPRQFAITVAEAGQDAALQDEFEGVDDRAIARYYLTRYERPRTFAGFRSGPVTIFNRVFLARDEASARLIFAEQTALNERFPEAADAVGQVFSLELDPVGDDIRGLAACTGPCSGAERYVHQRVVSRTADVVTVVYLWGLSDPAGLTARHSSHFAAMVAYRLPSPP